MDFSYLPWTVRTVVRIIVSSTFLSRVSKVAIKIVDLRREHRARLLKMTNVKDDHDDQAAAADADADVADAIPTFTTMLPFQSVAVLAFLYYF